MKHRVKRQLWLILEDSHANPWLQRLFEWPLLLLILANVAAVAAETVEPFASQHRDALIAFEIVSVAIFTAEYLARLWIATEHPAFHGQNPWKTRLSYACSPFALIDLLAILPFYLAFLVSVDLRFLRVLRLLRIFKLTRYSSAMTMLLNVFREELSSFCAAFFILIIILILLQPGTSFSPASASCQWAT